MRLWIHRTEVLRNTAWAMQRLKPLTPWQDVKTPHRLSKLHRDFIDVEDTNDLSLFCLTNVFQLPQDVTAGHRLSHISA